MSQSNVIVKVSKRVFDSWSEPGVCVGLGFQIGPQWTNPLSDHVMKCSCTICLIMTNKVLFFFIFRNS